MATHPAVLPIAALLLLGGCAGSSALDSLRGSAPVATLDLAQDYRQVNACVVDHFLRQNLFVVPNLREAEHQASVTVFTLAHTTRRMTHERPMLEVTSMQLQPSGTRMTLRQQPMLFADSYEANSLKRDLQGCGVTIAMR